jgi:membrane peptidoglycan carboxypeptidase
MDFGRSRRQRYSSRIFFYSKITRLAFFALLAGIVMTALLFVWYGRDLPTPSKLSASNLSQSTRILDRNGVVLYDIYGEQNRTYVKLSEMSKYLPQATIAVEDKNFYKNEGFSITGLLRGLLIDPILRQRVTGGSTITQQLVKNALLTSERTVPRKIKEFMLAIQVDRKYSKDQILELYLNVAPYGGTNVGVETASEQYFGKKARDLNLIESAILAGMPQRPSYFSPYGPNPQAYVSRTKDVLRRMREDGYISKALEEEAVRQLPNVKFLPLSQSIKAPHFSFYVKNLLIEEFGEGLVEHGGLQVTTTLDYKLQGEAEKVVKEEVANVRNLKVSNGASVVLNPKNGEILAMVGSKDFFATESAGLGGRKTPFEGQFNVMTQGHRQPGSSIKPVMYATALEEGYTAASLIMDTKTVFPNQGGKDYIPENYTKKYSGPVQMRFALGSSLNVPAVKWLALIGIQDMLKVAYDMGISTFAPTTENINRFGLSVTLGGGEVIPLELASSYTVFANGGKRMEPVAIAKVTDREGKTLYENNKNKSPRSVLSEEVAFIISHMLTDNNARLLTFGENSLLNIRGRSIAVKTGTTDDRRDNWAVGWTPSVLVLAWVGNNDNSPMGDVASGVTGATPIWRKIILESLRGKPDEEFAKPGNIQALTIDAYGGGLPVDGKPTRSEYFIKGTEPVAPANIYQDLRVSKSDKNRLATQEEIDKGEYELRRFIVFKENDPISTDGRNRWQDGIGEWLDENHKDDPLYRPPSL